MGCRAHSFKGGLVADRMQVRAAPQKNSMGNSKKSVGPFCG